MVAAGSAAVEDTWVHGKRLRSHHLDATERGPKITRVTNLSIHAIARILTSEPLVTAGA
jgi:hypothetical protein